MPKIPRLTQQSQYGIGREATGQDFGAGAGAATAQLGQSVDAVGDIARQFADAERRSTVSAQVAETGVKLEALRAELEQKLDGVSGAEDPFGEIERLRGEYRERSKEVIQEGRGRIRGAAYQRLFSDRTSGIAGRFGLQVNEAARARSLERIRGQTVTAVEKLADLISATDDDDQRSDYLRQIQETLANAVASGAYTEEQAAREAASADDIIRASELRSDSQGAADDIYTETSDPRERLALARQRYSGQKRDRVVARIKDRNAEDVALKKATDDARFDAAVTRAQAGQLTRTEALELGLGGSELNVVMNIIDKPDKAVTDWSLFFELRAQGSRPGTRDTFRSLDLRQYADKLAPEQYKELQTLQLADDADAIDSFEQKVDQALAGLELPTTVAGIAKANDKERERSTLFRRRIEAERRRRESAAGRKLTSAEQDELVDFAVQDVVTDVDLFRDDTASRFTVRPDEVGDVPEAVLKSIRSEMRTYGLDPNDEDLAREIYLEKLLRGEL